MSDNYAGQCPHLTEEKKCICAPIGSRRVCPLEAEYNRMMREWYEKVKQCQGIGSSHDGQEGK